jgi:hypothetical protein
MTFDDKIKRGQLSRRDLLKWGAVGASGMILGPGILSPRKAFADIAIVGSVVYNNGNNDISIVKTGATAGNAIIILIYTNQTIAASSPAISGETVSKAGSETYNNTTFDCMHVYYVKNLATSGDKTFTTTGNNYGAWGAAMIELSGQNITDFIDATSPTGAQSGMSVNVSTTVSNAAIFAVGAHDNAPVSASADPYNDLAILDIYSYARGEYNLNVGALGSKTVQFTSNEGGNSVMYAVAVRPAGGAPPSTGIRHGVHQP